VKSFLNIDFFLKNNQRLLHQKSIPFLRNEFLLPTFGKVGIFVYIQELTIKNYLMALIFPNVTIKRGFYSDLRGKPFFLEKSQKHDFDLN
jgi:hypothetical protein